MYKSTLNYSGKREKFPLLELRRDKNKKKLNKKRKSGKKYIKKVKRNIKRYGISIFRVKVLERIKRQDAK